MIGQFRAACSAVAVALAWLSCVTAPAQVNLAAAREGARVVASSGSLDGQSAAANLIDGDPTTTWATRQDKVEDEWAIVRLAGGSAREIGAIAIDNSPADGHPAEAGIRNFRVLASTASRDDLDFRSIHIGSCRMDGGRQVFTFEPAPATFVKLIIRGNHGHPDFAEVAELEIHEAGAPPVVPGGPPSILLYTRHEDLSAGPYAALAESLREVGAAVSAYPGEDSRRPLKPAALIGVRVIISAGEAGLPMEKEDLQTLSRFVRRGGGLVCFCPADRSPLQSLLDALDVNVGPPADATTPFALDSHWITEGLSLAGGGVSGPTLEMVGGEALATADGRAVAIAGAVGEGRLVVLPPEFLSLTGDSRGDSLELIRRAALWAAAMEDVGLPEPPKPVVLSGTAAFLDGGQGQAWERSFERLHDALSERGLHVDAPQAAAEFTHADLGDADLLIAFMPTFDAATGLELSEWVRSGGALLVLADADAEVPALIRVNEFLREFGGAVAHSPTKNVSVAIRPHPATEGVRAVSRPGEALGAWCLQGASLAQMAATPIATARTFGAGRVIIMDGGLAVDPVRPETGPKQPEYEYGIHLAQNEELVLRCVAWLLADDVP